MRCRREEVRWASFDLTEKRVQQHKLLACDSPTLSHNFFSQFASWSRPSKLGLRLAWTADCEVEGVTLWVASARRTYILEWRCVLSSALAAEPPGEWVMNNRRLASFSSAPLPT
jgi:hypothetical protein